MRSFDEIYRTSRRHLNLTWCLLLVEMAIFSFLVFFYIAEHVRTVSMLMVERFNRMIGKIEREVKIDGSRKPSLSRTFYIADMDGNIKKGYPSWVEGLNIRSTPVFNEAEKLPVDSFYLIFYPDIVDGKGRLHFVNRVSEDAVAIMTVDTEDIIFHTPGVGEVVALTPGGVCKWSTNESYLGSTMKMKPLIFKGFRLLVVRKAEYDKLPNLRVYYLKDVTTTAYTFAGVILISLILFLFVLLRTKHLDVHLTVAKLEYRDIVRFITGFHNIVAGRKHKLPEEDISELEEFFTRKLLDAREKKYSLRENQKYMEALANLLEYTLVLFDNLRREAEEIDAYNEELESMNEELNQMYEDLEASYRRIDMLVSNLEDMIELTSKLGIKEAKEERFLRDLLRIAIHLIPEADCGSVMVFEGDKARYLAAVGHDERTLRKLNLKKEHVITYEDIKQFTGAMLRFDAMSEELANNVSQAFKPVHVTLSMPLYVGEEVGGQVFLNISKESDTIFSEESMRVAHSLSNLASAFLTMKRYSKIQGEFQKEIILSLIKVLEIHDYYTKGHSEFVAVYSARLAEILGLKPEDIRKVYWAGLLHDIGKILISSSILNKPARLSEEEFEEIKKHPIYGYEILRTSRLLQGIAEIVLHHHERPNGKGYPRGTKDIPLEARIIAVVDAFEAMKSGRPYKPSYSLEKCLEELRSNAGTQFDPEIVEVFIKMILEDRHLMYDF